MIWDLLLDSVSDPYFWFILVSVLFVSWWFVSSRFSGPANSPPSPPGSWLLLGHLPAIFKRGGKIYETFTSWSQTLGPVYNVRLFGRDITVVSGYDAVKELFVGCGDAFMDRPDLYIPKTITRGKGIIFQSYGNTWKEMRRLALMTMRDLGVGKTSLEDKILEEASAVEYEVEKEIGKPFNMRRLLQNATANVVCAINFGKRFEYSDPKFQRLLDLINQFFATNVMMSPANFYPWFRHVPGLGLGKPLTIMDETRKLVEENIRDHRDSFDPRNLRDFVDVYLKAELEEEEDESNNNEKTFEEGQLFQVIHDLFNAGSETAATTLSWMCYYLVRYSEIQAKCHEQIDKVVGAGRRVSMKDKPSLTWVEAMILETQRVANAIPIAPPHAPGRDVMYRGYHIPKGRIVFANLWSVHHDPSYWSEPYQYKPSRWIDGGQLVKHEAFMPFSAGRRMCAGQQLAQMELFLIITHILQRFTLKAHPLHPLPDDDGVTGVTRSPKHFLIQAEPRY